MEWAKKSAKIHGLKLKIIYFNEEKVRKDLRNICEIIESNNVVKTGVAIPFYYAAQKAKKDKVRTLFSGLGSEEIFAGYERHKTKNTGLPSKAPG